MSSITAGTSAGTALIHTADTTGSFVVKTGSGSTTGLTVDGSQITTLANPLPVASGGTGTTSAAFVNLTSNVTGTLPVGNGGTGITTTPTAGAVPYGNGTTLAYTAAGTSGQVLTSAGAGAPTWSTVAAPIGTDITYGDYTLTLATAIASSNTTAPFVQTVALDANKELLLIHHQTSLQAVVFDNSTKTFGTVVLVRTALLNVVNTVAGISISSSAVLVCSLATVTTALETVVLTISGSTITVNTALATVLGATSRLITANTRLVTVGSSYVLNYFDNTTSQQRFRAITVSGSTPSIGAELVYAGGTSTTTHHSYAISSSVLLAFSSVVGTTYANPISVSGTTLTNGTAATVVNSTSADIVTGLLSTNNVALAYRTSAVLMTGAVVSVSGTIASISVAATTLAVNTYSPQMQVFSNQAFIVSGTTGTNNISVITDTAGVATVGTPLSISAQVMFGFLSTGKVFLGPASTIDGSYFQYGISSGAAVLEKTFPAVYISSGVNAIGQSTYTYPLSGLSNSNTSGTNAISLRLTSGKIVPFGNSNAPFSTSADGTSTARLQQSAYTVTTRAVNSSLSTAVGWGIIPLIIETTTSLQVRRLELT